MQKHFEIHAAFFHNMCFYEFLIFYFSFYLKEKDNLPTAYPSKCSQQTGQGQESGTPPRSPAWTAKDQVPELPAASQGVHQ